MKGLKILWLVAAGCLMAGLLHADIYEWTDENGVKHFTNHSPPDGATILMKTEELPYDEAADRARMESEKQYLLELAKLEMAAREAELQRRAAEAERRAAEAERRAAEAERQAQETLRAAEQSLDDARSDRWYYRGVGYYGYYALPYSGHHKGKHWTKIHLGHSERKYGDKYKRKKHAGDHRYRSPYTWRPRSPITHGTQRVSTRGVASSGKGHPGG